MKFAIASILLTSALVGSVEGQTAICNQDPDADYTLTPCGGDKCTGSFEGEVICVENECVVNTTSVYITELTANNGQEGLDKLLSRHCHDVEYQCNDTTPSEDGTCIDNLMKCGDDSFCQACKHEDLNANTTGECIPDLAAFCASAADNLTEWCVDNSREMRHFPDRCSGSDWQPSECEIRIGPATFCEVVCPILIWTLPPPTAPPTDSGAYAKSSLAVVAVSSVMMIVHFW